MRISDPVIGTSQDSNLLLPDGDLLERAVAKGRLAREKVRGQWLYFVPEFSIEVALSQAERAIAEPLEDWLLGGNPYLATVAARFAVHPKISKKAMTVLIRELCCQARLLGFGLVSQGYEPYLAFYLPRDRVEVERQLDAMRTLLATRGRVDWRDLPEPVTPRPKRAWRLQVVGHGEFLGLGWMPKRGELVAW